jgi:four helix bundle protein
LYNIADQLKRASLSISLNIAEGSSKTIKDYKRFIGIARGSCFECVPIIDIAHKQKLISGKQKEIWYTTLAEIAKMLSSLKNKLHS